MNNSINSNATQQDDIMHNIAFFTSQPVMVDIPKVQQVMPNKTPREDKAPTPNVLTPEQMNMLVEQCKPQAMGNPVKITESSYLITEQQMIYLLSLAQGNPQPNMMSQSQKKVQPVQQQQIVIGTQPDKRTGNAVDTLCNATLGTAGRIAHAFTGVVDSVVDVLTLGYSTRR